RRVGRSSRVNHNFTVEYCDGQLCGEAAKICRCELRTTGIEKCLHLGVELGQRGPKDVERSMSLRCGQQPPILEQLERKATSGRLRGSATLARSRWFAAGHS